MTLYSAPQVELIQYPISFPRVNSRTFKAAMKEVGIQEQIDEATGKILDIGFIYRFRERGR